MFDSIDQKDKGHWFAYINEVITKCMAPQKEGETVTHVTKQCHDENVIKTLKSKEFTDKMELEIDWDHYDKCVVEQGKTLETANESDTQGSFIMRDMKALRFVGASFHPSISVKNHTYKGNYKDANNVFKAICSTMEEDKDNKKP